MSHRCVPKRQLIECSSIALIVSFSLINTDDPSNKEATILRDTMHEHFVKSTRPVAERSIIFGEREPFKDFREIAARSLFRNASRKGKRFRGIQYSKRVDR